MTVFVPGMRVVLAEGEWESGPRTAGHYGKVVQAGRKGRGEDGFILVEITGHIDGHPPMDFKAHDMHWFFPEELTVVD